MTDHTPPIEEAPCQYDGARGVERALRHAWEVSRGGRMDFRAFEAIRDALYPGVYPRGFESWLTPAEARRVLTPHNTGAALAASLPRLDIPGLAAVFDAFDGGENDR